MVSSVFWDASLVILQGPPSLENSTPRQNQRLVEAASKLGAPELLALAAQLTAAAQMGQE